MSDLAAYIADNYGHCERGTDCYWGKTRPTCLKDGWRGRFCPHWRPTTARNWEELTKLQKELHARPLPAQS